MLDLSVTELRSIAKNRVIKRYFSLDKDELLKTILLLSLSLGKLKSVLKFRKIRNYENMSENELLNAFKDSKPFRDSKEIKKNRDDDEIIRDLRFLYEAEENYYEPRKIKGAFGGNYVEYESNGDTGEISSVEGYLNKIRTYLSDIIDEHKDEWKIQLAAEITFSAVDEKDSEKFYPMHMHRDNLKVYIGSKMSKVVDDLFKSFLDEYNMLCKKR